MGLFFIKNVDLCIYVHGNAHILIHEYGNVLNKNVNLFVQVRGNVFYKNVDVLIQVRDNVL